MINKILEFESGGERKEPPIPIGTNFWMPIAILPVSQGFGMS